MAEGNTGNNPELVLPNNVNIVGLNQDFAPFSRALDRNIILRVDQLPDIPFQAKSDYGVQLSADDKKLAKAGILHTTSYKPWFTPQLLDRIIGLSVSISTPDGEFEARLNPHHLLDGYLTYDRFIRTDSEGKTRVWEEDSKEQEYLGKIKMRFLERDENRHKLPPDFDDPDWDGNKILAAKIDEEARGDVEEGQELREAILADPSRLKRYLLGPSGNYPILR